MDKCVRFNIIVCVDMKVFFFVCNVFISRFIIVLEIKYKYWF